mgnify:CR=1 FL=1
MKFVIKQNKDSYIAKPHDFRAGRYVGILP